MAVVFHHSSSDISLEVGEYEDFSRCESRKAPVKTWRSKFQRFNVVLLVLGLLCVLQAVLNICLRLTLKGNMSVSTGNSSVVLPSTPSPDRGTLPPPIKTTRDADVGRCPQDWLMFDSSCYYISSQRKNWDDSRQDCIQRGADLVVIGNRQEQEFLTRFTTVAWIGMTDRKKEGRFVWVDRTPVNRNMIQWAPGQPDNSNRGEDCGDLHNTVNFIGLNDFICSVKIPWICEKAVITVTEMNVTNATSTAPTFTLQR